MDHESTVESPTTEQQVQSTGVTSASPADEGVKQAEAQSPLEAVQAALDQEKPSEAEPPKETEGGQPESPKQDGEGKQQAEADSHEEFVKNLSPKARENWKRLEAERDGYKEQAEAFGRVTGAMREAGLNAQEFNAGFDIMATIKAVEQGRASPADALAKLAPYLQTLQAMAGEVLPQDLQERVAQGVIGEQEARELAQLRSEKATRDARTQRESAEAEQLHAENEARKLAASMGQAVTKWEQAWAKSDPDYEAKRALVKARVTELIQERGIPRTTDDAVRLSEDARKDIESQLSRFQPKRSDVKPVTGGRPSGTPMPAPKTPLEAVNQALNRT